MTTTNLTPPLQSPPEDLAEAILASRESANQALIEVVEAEATPPRKQAAAATLLSLADRAAPPRSPPAAVLGERYELTDLGNGLVFADWNAGDFRYCPPRGEWLAWDDRRWAPDAAKAATQAAKRLSQVWLGKAITISDPDGQKRAVKHWLKTQSASGVQNMLTMASTEPGIVILPTDLDRDPWLLNVLNGTLDLRTGQLQAPDPADLITRLCPVEYQPDADLAEWLRFLERVVPDAAARSFLQRAAGYSLTGDTREEVLFFVCGPTASGKSTFAEAVKSVLGDYAATSDFETFLARRATGGPRNDIARLEGARIVISIEVDRGQRLAEGLVKIVTGGDTVTARFLHKESREFRPTFKLWLCAL